MSASMGQTAPASNILYLPGCASAPVQNLPRRGRLPKAVPKLQDVRQERQSLRQRIAEIEERIYRAKCTCQGVEIMVVLAQEELQALQALLKPASKARGAA